MAKGWKRSIESAVGGRFLRWLQRRITKLSPEKAERLGLRLGRAYFRVSKKRREVTLRNILLAYPEMTEPERVQLAKKVFEHYGIATVDFLRPNWRNPESISKEIAVKGRDILDAAIAEKRGVLLITGHFGSWERFSAWVSVNGYPLTVIARNVYDPNLNQMVNNLRSMTGTRVVPRETAVRPMITALRNNELVGILPDQNSEEVYIPFFGHLAGTVLGPGVIQARTNALVLLATCVRTGPNQYLAEFRGPYEPQEGFEVVGEGMMRTINSALEEVIREHPEQWLWIHDRWKSARRKGLIP